MTDLNQYIINSVSDLFARDQFTTHLLSRSFNQPIGWIEIAVVVFAIFLAWTSNRYSKNFILKSITWNWLRPLIQQLIFPICLLIFGVIALLAWWLIWHLDAVWLRLLVFAANWMLMIRLILFIIHLLFPQHRFNEKLMRSTSGVLWVCFLFWVIGIDDLIINWLKNLKISIGSSQLNLFTILTGLLWVGIVMMLMTSLARWITTQLMASQRLEPNLRIVLSKIIKTLSIVLSVLIALPLVGIDLTVLSVFGGALGVGLGFGLQKIASNYVSGFIILADHSIHIGDRLTVNNFTGYVTEITSRFVVLQSATGQEALIPNEVFVTSTVINESYTEKSLYKSLDIQVAYHSDVTLALRIIKEAAQAQERILGEANAFLVGFGDNGVNLRVGFWVKDPENGFSGLFSAILLTIWQRFHEENIEFPYPQREIRILNQSDNEPSEMAMLRASLHAQTENHSKEPHSAESNH